MTAWRIAPDSDKFTPTSIATIVRGKRIFSSICRLVSSSTPKKICAVEISTEPLIKLKKNPATVAAKIKDSFMVFMP